MRLFIIAFAFVITTFATPSLAEYCSATAGSLTPPPRLALDA